MANNRTRSIALANVLSLVVLMSGSASTSISADKSNSDSSTILSLRTVAEQSNYLATSRESDVTKFLEALDAASPYAQLVQYGATNEERPLWALVISKEEGITLPLPPEDHRLTVVIFGGIHSGECDGKEALLALARDWLAEKSPKYLDDAVLIVAPNFNADGNERVGPGNVHRPGQEGPARGMGTRENAIGQDLNRDFVKLDSPEVRSLVRMIDAWDADVLIDAHTTNGSLHRYDMTYDLPHNPAANQDLMQWMRSDMLPKVSSDMAARGAPVFYYGNFNREHTVWESYGFEPRYSTEYMGLRGKIGILVESYSYASYQRRVEVSYWFIDECLKQLTKNREALYPMLNPKTTGTPKGIPIQGKIVSGKEQVNVSAYQWATNAKSNPGNAPEDRDHGDKKTESPGSKFPSPRDRNRTDELAKTEYKVTVANIGEPTLKIDAPTYYFVPDNNAWVAGRLRLHGIDLYRVNPMETADSASVQKLAATRYKITERKDLNEFQFRRMRRYQVEADGYEFEASSGGWIVPTNQKLGVLATYLLEPHSDESFAMWGFFDPELKEGSYYPVVRLETKPSRTASAPLPKLKWREMIPSDVTQERLTLPKLFDPEQRVSYSGLPSPIPKWVPGSENYLIQRDNRWFSVDCATGAMQPFDRQARLVEALGKLEPFADGQAAQYGRQLNSFDDRFETAMIRHKNDLYLYRTADEKATRLTDSPEVEEELPELSPAGTHVAYVYDKNIYVVGVNGGEPKKLTLDGGGEILNGKLDWVYQEEIYGRGQFRSFWWNPDGTMIAYIRLDETPVPNFVIDNSLSFAQKIENMRYPKAGQNNPLATLHVVEIASGKTIDVPVSQYAADDRLIVRVGWNKSNPKQVVYQLQNRIQNKLDVIQYDVSNFETKMLVHEESEAWIDVIDVPRWLADGSFIWVSDSDHGRRHLFRVDTNGKKTQLTKGEWDVKDVAAITDDGKYVWFTGHQSAPTNTDALRLELATGKLETMGTKGGSHRISVHSTGKYYFESVSDLKTQAQAWLCDDQGKHIRYVGNYRSDRLDYLNAGDVELFQIPARDGTKMSALLYKPKNFESRKKAGKMPVVIHVYGGPSAPTVENSWTHRSDLWHRYLAEQGICVLLCDNRSALGRGNQDTWKIYRDLGRVELSDLEDAVGWLGQQDWADAKRVGLWGWSYGGYFTAYALTHSKLFKAGISGAPVTDWHNYDSVYTERYMSTPQLNPEGYKNSSVVEAAAGLSGSLLLMHGEIDDNVHMANTMQFVHALQKAGKKFELMVYPNNRHGISDPSQSYHQYQTMTDFFVRNLME